MGQITDIISGHINEVLGKNEELSEHRLEICKKCPLYKETYIGPICNPELYINITDKESISNKPKIGYRQGCNCRLTAKSRLPNAKCIISKW